MARPKAALLLAVAMVFGLLAMVAASKHMRNARLGTAATRDATEIVVAARDIAFGTKLIAEDLSTLVWPGKPAFEGAVGEPGDIVGRVTTMPLARGEPILEAKLAAEGSKEALAALIPTGMRAMTVQIDKAIEAGGLLVRGSRVDVVVTIEPDEHTRAKMSKTILQNIEVLCAGPVQSPEDDKAPAGYSSHTTVVLLVKPNQAEALAHACTEGKIRLVLRAFADDAAEETPGITALKLLPARAKPKDRTPKAARKERPEPTAKDQFNIARCLAAQGQTEQAISKYRELMARHPESELCVEAQQQIEAILNSRRAEQQRAECQSMLVSARQAVRDGAFKHANDLCLRLVAEHSNVTLGDGTKVKDEAGAIHEQLVARDKEANRIHQLFRNYLSQKLVRNAQTCLSRLRKEFPKSTYCSRAESAFAQAPPAPVGPTHGRGTGAALAAGLPQTLPKVD